MPRFVAVTYCCGNTARQTIPSVGEFVTAITHTQGQVAEGWGQRASGALGLLVILSMAEAHGGWEAGESSLSPGSEWTRGHFPPILCWPKQVT